MTYRQAFYINWDIQNNCSVEQLILNIYKTTIEYYLRSKLTFSFKLLYNPQKNYDIDIVAIKDMPKNIELENLRYFTLCVLDNKLLDKYAAYVWRDYFISYRLGMLLNNADKNHPVNCIMTEDWRIVTTNEIKSGESLRLDYGYNENNYPPIPQEIIDIRKKLLELKN